MITSVLPTDYSSLINARIIALEIEEKRAKHMDVVVDQQDEELKRLRAVLRPLVREAKVNLRGQVGPLVAISRTSLEALVLEMKDDGDDHAMP